MREYERNQRLWFIRFELHLIKVIKYEWIWIDRGEFTALHRFNSTTIKMQTGTALIVHEREP